jgi:pimeloyl-ACP methyl ester carboxylesterase
MLTPPIRALVIAGGVVGAVGAVAMGALLYLLVSFAVMRRHTAARPFVAALGSLAREALAIAVTQPLVPLFYMVGRRMGGTPGGRPIVFVHGYFQNRADFVYLARAARRAGLGPLYGFNYNWARGVRDAAAHLDAFVERVVRETSRQDVALVAHSLGGVVALEYLATDRGRARVARCVTIASPHAGVAWRVGMIGRGARDLRSDGDYMRGAASRPLPIRVLSVFSSHDNIVHPKTTSVLAARGGDDLEVDGVGHLSMLFSRRVAEATVKALAD